MPNGFLLPPIAKGESKISSASKSIKKNSQVTNDNQPLTLLLSSSSCSFKEVLLGVHVINKEENESRQKARVTHSYPHPCFDRKEAVNDLMLLKVRSHGRGKLTNTKCWLLVLATVV